MNQPDTNASLLLRIRDSGDRDAWNDFSNIYRPAIVQMARKKGMQNSDAEDLAQVVLVSISKSIKSFDASSNQARFRTWLHRVTHNAILNAISRRAPDLASGKTEVSILLEESAPVDSEDSRTLSLEIRRQLFTYAASIVKKEFSDATWSCFWQTAVEGHSIERVASEIERTRGSVYAARSRVMRRLKDKVNELQLEDSVRPAETNEPAREL